jgi:hypothetical protein
MIKSFGAWGGGAAISGTVMRLAYFQYIMVDPRNGSTNIVLKRVCYTTVLTLVHDTVNIVPTLSLSMVTTHIVIARSLLSRLSRSGIMVRST